MGNKQLPRGIRNNNPGNLKELSGDKTQWQGERATDDDPIFEEFETMEYGIRALMKILINYMKKYKLRTIIEIIKRFAPASENDTRAYINSVSWITGFEDNEILAANEDTISKLVTAICFIENGGYFITNEEIAEAWGML